MATVRGRGALAIVTAVVLLGLGAGVGIVAGDALGVRTEPATQMQPAPPSVPAVAASIAPPRFTTVDAPDGPRMDAALDELLTAVTDAPSRAGEASLTVVAGAAIPTTEGAADAGDDTYRVTGSAEALRIEAASLTGAVRGVYDLAATIRAGGSVTERLGRTVTSRLPFRMVDLGAVGVTADPAEWESGTNYSHVSGAFEDAYLESAPYVDDQALEGDFAEWQDFVKHSVSLGYNAIAWPGFLEYVTLETDGVYPAGDEHVARAKALRAAFEPFWDYAREMGVKVFLRTDMLSLTPALNTYFEQHFPAADGSPDAANPELWKVYADALDELYADSPALSGILIRIGEGGSIYQLPGWDYYSALAVRTVDAVQAMLRAFTAQAEASDREVIFRTWSVGIGAVGDMHTDAASYEQVLKGIDSPKLIVSTKYTLGDFYSWLPLNDTLEVGDQRRIVEFQSRREFEGFGAFPNDLGPEFQWALQKLLAANPHIEGVWTWTQDGGPWRAGPMSLYLQAGFWQLYELNTVVAGALARDPDADVGAVTEGWVRQWFSDDPKTITAIAEAMASSRDAIKQGLYLQQFAEQRVFAIGLEPPPQMWLFEWDILTGDSATLDVMYTIVKDHIDETVARGDDAVRIAQRMHDDVASTDASTWRSPEMRDALIGSLAYESDTLRLLAAYRSMFLYQAQWHDTLSPDSYAKWQAARDGYEKLAAAHLDAYSGDVDHPAWNLTAAQLGVDRADRDLAMAWLARGLAVLAIAWVVIGMVAARTRLVRRPGAAAARASWIASTRPWRARESTLGMLPLDRWLMVLVPAALLVATRAVQTSFLAPAQLAVTLGAWAVFIAVVLVLLRGRSPWAVIAAVGGVVVLRCVLVLIALSFSGPGGYWFAFFADPGRRVLYITVAFALFLWGFVAAGWALGSAIGARRATGTVLAAVGAGLAVPAAVVALIGLEQALTVWNDQMGLLPWGLARILGITTYLEIPDATAWYAAAFGAVLLVVGVLLTLPWRGAEERPRMHRRPGQSVLSKSP
jgi:alpha-glucuronidase